MEGDPMTDTKEVIKLEEADAKEVSIFEKTANELKITSAADVEAAVDTLGSIKKMQKHLKAQEDGAKKPYQELVKGIIAAFKKPQTDLAAAESTIKSKISTFRAEEARKAEEKKAKIEARVGEGKGKLKVQTAINQISDVEQSKSAAHVDTGNSKMTVRMIKKVRITDESLIPRDYLVVDNAKVRAAAVKIYDLKKEGVEVAMIPGVEVYEEESIGAS
jgi:hypothetical protein